MFPKRMMLHVSAQTHSAGWWHRSVFAHAHTHPLCLSYKTSSQQDETRAKKEIPVWRTLTFPEHRRAHGNFQLSWLTVVCVLNFINDMCYHLRAASSLLNGANSKISVENKAFVKHIFSSPPHATASDTHSCSQPWVSCCTHWMGQFQSKYSSNTYKSLEWNPCCAENRGFATDFDSFSVGFRVAVGSQWALLLARGRLMWFYTVRHPVSSCWPARQLP